MHVALENIQSYDGSKDIVAVADLWQAALGPLWPLERGRIEQVLAGPQAHHMLVRENGRVIGFVATFVSQRGSERLGQLAALVVAPDRQREGVGTVLHETALAHFRSVGVDTIQLGSITPRFWCGVPTNLPTAAAFFRAQGWQLGETVYDLVQDLTRYATPERVWRRLADEQMQFATITSQDVTDVLAFERSEFPNWLGHFEHHADLGDYNDLLVARDRDGRIVASLVMYAPQSHPERTDVIWQTLLGQQAGGIAAVGVARVERGRGIGVALVAYASELLKERGVRNCYIDWVSLTDFYARLGYEKWRAYSMGWRDLP